MPFDSTTSSDLAQYEAYVCTDEGAAIARAVVQSTDGNSAAIHGGVEGDEQGDVSRLGGSPHLYRGGGHICPVLIRR